VCGRRNQKFVSFPLFLDATGNVGIVVTRAPVPPRGTVRSYVRIVGAITTTKLRVPTDILDVDKCLAWSDEEVEQATVRLDIHTDGQRIRRLLWIPSEGGHTAGESSKATVTCTEFVSQNRRSLALQQLTQQPESSTSSRKRAPGCCCSSYWADMSTPLGVWVLVNAKALGPQEGL
jgi:hypothetical protein